MDNISNYTNNYLLNNNFDSNSKIKNLNLLEAGLIRYTRISLEKEVTLLPNAIFFKLGYLLEEMNKYVPEEDKENYFNSYNEYILEALSKINNQDKLKIMKIELDSDILIIEKNEKIKAILVNELLEPYKVPSAIINEYRKILEKNPTK